jgi:hypothetical protein
MPDVPQEAVDAAAIAIELELTSETFYYEAADSDEKLARVALEAAAPILAEHVARRILAHMDRSTRYRNRRNRRGLPAYRRHFRTAARVAAGAFTTDEDLKREAAKALVRICNRHMAENGGSADGRD